MRRPVLAVMTGLTALVVGLGIRAGGDDGVQLSTVAAAPTGVVAATQEPATTTPSASPTAAATSASATVNGAAAQTRYGPVQVQITVKDGQIVAADAVVYPTQDRRDQEINAVAIPELDDAVLQAQSAQIDTVSGATVTSIGYLTSLQSAIDQANAAGVL